MTNTAKKPAKKSDKLDLDLDARLDSATATLYLDDEPVEGDMLDQVLAKAKKELDTVLPEPDDIDLDAMLNLSAIDDLELSEDEQETALQSESITSLENQLAAVMDSSAVSDDELDNLLGSGGYDFDSLLGDADDELSVNSDENEINEESLLAAVDELLNFGVEPEIVEIAPEVEAIVEPEIVEIAPEVEAIVEPEIVEIEPEVESIIEPEVVEIEPEVESIVEPEIVEIAPEVEAIVEPEIVESAPEVEAIVEPEIVESAPEVEAIVEPEIVEIAPEDNTDLGLNFEFETEVAEMPLEPEAETIVDSEDNTDLGLNFEFETEMPETEINQEIELDDTQEIELTVEPDAALDDLVDSVPFEDTLKIESEDTAEDDFFVEEFNDVADVADIAAPLVEISLPTDDELDVAQQLDGLNDAMENKIDDTAAGFDLLGDADEKAQATPATETVEDDLDWMKQLEGLDAPVDDDDDDDWMKQLEGLDAESTTEEKPAEAVAVADDDDWMKQLDGLDAEATTEEKPVEAGAADDDWTKQLEGIEDSKTIDDFNIADETAPQSAVPAIDEASLIAKAAEAALAQFKEEQESAIGAINEKQDLAVTQLRADQDNFEAKNRKQFTDAENGRKKAATFGFAALGVGILGLIGSGTIGYFSMGTKTETESLTQSVAELQETVNGIVSKSPEKEKEIAGIKTSVEQLNQKVEKLVAAQAAGATPALLTEAGKIAEVKTGEPAKSAVNLLNGKTQAVAAKVASTTTTTGKVDTGLDAPKLAETEIAPPVDIAPEHPTGEKVAPKLADMAKKTSDDAKAKADKIAKEKAEQAKAKEEAALLTEKLTKISNIAKAAAASTKTDEPRASRFTGKMTRGMARGIAKDRNESKTSSTKMDAKKEVLKAEIKQPKAAPEGKYGVNVVSYQQEWFAQSKAAEFKAKGIPVEVSPIDPSKVGTKYRLRVGGFKTKAEASAYAKSKGLSDAWVSN